MHFSLVKPYLPIELWQYVLAEVPTRHLLNLQTLDLFGQRYAIEELFQRRGAEAVTQQTKVLNHMLFVNQAQLNNLKRNEENWIPWLRTCLKDEDGGPAHQLAVLMTLGRLMNIPLDLSSIPQTLEMLRDQTGYYDTYFLANCRETRMITYGQTITEPSGEAAFSYLIRASKVFPALSSQGKESVLSSLLTILSSLTSVDQNQGEDKAARQLIKTRGTWPALLRIAPYLSAGDRKRLIDTLQPIVQRGTVPTVDDGIKILLSILLCMAGEQPIQTLINALFQSPMREYGPLTSWVLNHAPDGELHSILNRLIEKILIYVRNRQEAVISAEMIQHILPRISDTDKKRLALLSKDIQLQQSFHDALKCNILAGITKYSSQSLIESLIEDINGLITSAREKGEIDEASRYTSILQKAILISREPRPDEYYNGLSEEDNILHACTRLGLGNKLSQAHERSLLRILNSKLDSEPDAIHIPLGLFPNLSNFTDNQRKLILEVFLVFSSDETQTEATSIPIYQSLFRWAPFMDPSQYQQYIDHMVCKLNSGNDNGPLRLVAHKLNGVSIVSLLIRNLAELDEKIIASLKSAPLEKNLANTILTYALTNAETLGLRAVNQNEKSKPDTLSVGS